jgi:formylglycine-generating enzyme required for sulfatase activity
MCLLAIVACVLCNIGCGDNDDSSSTSDSDTDTDTDSDTGTDTDTDTDSDADTDTDEEQSVWITIKAGSFWMGSPDGNCPVDYPGGTDCEAELGRNPDEDLHYVTLTRSFEIRSTEVTQIQYQEVTGWNPSFYGPYTSQPNCGPDCPVERFSWYDALAYTNELSHIAGLTPCYIMTDIVCADSTNVGTDYLGCMNDEQKIIESATITLNGVSSVYDCEGYRLPTESEWEYATRAGSLTAFHPSEGNDGSITQLENDPNQNQIGWSHPLAEFITHPVALKKANAWGLCDTSGNVNEYTWDVYVEAYPSGDTLNPVVDPEGPLPSDETVSFVGRGGHHSLPALYARSARRIRESPGSAKLSLGFRPVRSLL